MARAAAIGRANQAHEKVRLTGCRRASMRAISDAAGATGRRRFNSASSSMSELSMAVSDRQGVAKAGQCVAITRGGGVRRNVEMTPDLFKSEFAPDLEVED